MFVLITRALAFLPALLSGCTGPPPNATPELPALDSGAGVCASPGYDVSVEWSIGTWVPQVDAPADCTTGAPATHLEDFTGDGRADLILTDACDDATIGRDAWRVWPGVEGGFGAEVTWSLPAGFGEGAFDAPRSGANCEGTEDIPAWFTAQMDGDGLPDLVVTESCVDPNPGAGTWTVWPNTGAGFGAQTARVVDTRWSAGALTEPQILAVCVGGRNAPAWDLFDIDGDGLDDVVFTSNCVDPTVGSTHWEVLHNDGSAFTSTTWPVVPELEMVARRRAEGSCVGFFLLDVDGDRRDDVVATALCEGGSSWNVWPNTGAGFSRVSESLEVPWAEGALIDQAEGPVTDCTSGRPSWFFEDSDADGATDMMITGTCTDAGVGDGHWNWWRQTDRGWNVASSWALPIGWSPASFQANKGTDLDCAGTRNTPRWVRQDLDGDGVSELILTQTCDAPEAARWRVYTSTCLD